LTGAGRSPPAPPRRRWRSVGAVVAGFVVVFVLSVGTDQVLHVLKVYPPWGEPMAGALYVMATAYRIVYTILGGYITARLAPDAPVRHALILGLVGLVAGLLGVIANIAKPELGPLWYSIAVLVTGPPRASLGGLLYGYTQSGADSHAEDHPVAVVPRQSRRGDEFLPLDLQA